MHTPEFSFEHELDRVRQATKERAIDYPVALDNDYAVWSAFDNHYWPALYFVDRDGVIRDHHFGEGRYEQSERVIQRLLGIERELVSVEGSAWRRRPTGTTCAHPRPISATGAASTSRRRTAPRSDQRHATSSPSACALNQWATRGEWTIGRESVVLDRAGGSIAYRFHARDAHLVLSPEAHGPIPFRVLLDGEAPGRVTRRRRRRGRQRRAPGRPPVPARATARRRARADARDHVPRARRRGLRVHVWLTVRAS